MERFLDDDDLRLLAKSDIRALEALAKHLIAGKKENTSPGKPKLRPRLLELVGGNKPR